MGFLLFLWLPIDDSSIGASTHRQAASASVTQTKSAVSKIEFDIIEGRFHDGLGTFAEINLANEIIKAANLSQPLFDASRAESKMREALESLPLAHASRAIFQQEIATITAATQSGARALLQRTKPAVLLRVRHTPSDYADAKAADLRLQFADDNDLPISVKTDKSNKVAVAEGQTPHLYEKWAARYFRVSTEEWQRIIADLGFASQAEWKWHYLNAARLVAEVLIRKLKLKDYALDDFSKAKVTDLEALKYLLRQLKFYKSGNDRSCVIIFDRSTGAVKWESRLDEIDIESVTVDRVSFLPARPRNAHPIATEFGVKIDLHTVVSFQVKHKRGRARLSAQQFEFSDITTRLRINR
ncbi:MAG: hypothetical protein HY231_25460 [Acidobacteria bacterium]|nr:hypothetical protein [Acidobacteriota bacterium]